MTAQEPFHDFVGRTSGVALRGVLVVALVHDVDLIARRRRVASVVSRARRRVGGLTHGIRLRLRRGVGKRQRPRASQQPPSPW